MAESSIDDYHLRERLRLVQEERDSARQSLSWLRDTCASQMAEHSLAVAQLSSKLTLVLSRLSGEQDLRSSTWDRRLAIMQV